MKKVLLTIFLMLSIVLVATTVNAAYTAKMIGDKTELMPENEITIGVSVADIDVGQDGISAFSAIIDYDSNVFEEVTQASFTAQNNWTVVGYNPADKKINMTNSGFIKTEQEIVAIKLKVKASATIGKTTITLKDIKASNNEDDISTSNVSYNVEIKQKSSDGNININDIISNITNSTTNNNTVSNNTTNNTVNNNTKNNIVTIPTINSNKTNNTSNTNGVVNGNNTNSIPYTGVEDYIMPITFVGIIFAAIAYINYRKYKEI